MTEPKRPASEYDGTHISKDVRAKLSEQIPEIANRIREVADTDKSTPPASS
jgi:hypothetical protein